MVSAAVKGGPLPAGAPVSCSGGAHRSPGQNHGATFHGSPTRKAGVGRRRAEVLRRRTRDTCSKHELRERARPGAPSSAVPNAATPGGTGRGEVGSPSTGLLGSHAMHADLALRTIRPRAAEHDDELTWEEERLRGPSSRSRRRGSRGRTGKGTGPSPRRMEGAVQERGLRPPVRRAAPSAGPPASARQRRARIPGGASGPGRDVARLPPVRMHRPAGRGSGPPRDDALAGG